MVAEEDLPDKEQLTTPEEREVEEIVESIMRILERCLAVPVIGGIAKAKIRKFLEMIDSGKLGDKHVAEIMNRVILRIRELKHFK